MARLKKRRKGVSSKHRLVKRKQPGGNSSVIGKWGPRRTPRDNYNKLGIIGQAEKVDENAVEKAGGSDSGEFLFIFIKMSFVVAAIITAIRCYSSLQKLNR